MSKGIRDLFLNFLVLRLYLPGLIFLTLVAGSAFMKKEFTAFEPGLHGSPIFWVLLPIVVGLFFHLVTASVVLLFGSEQVRKNRESSIYKSIQERIGGRSVYKKDRFAVAKIFQLAQLYGNTAIGLFTFSVINFIWGDNFRWSLFGLIFFSFALICSVWNFQYGRAILAHPDFK